MTKRYDKNGKFIKKWCPELKLLPVEFIHQPWNMNKGLQKRTRFRIGYDYPKPIECEKY